MKLECRWKEKMLFAAEAGGHSILMDTRSPVGTDQAMTPKQLLIAGVCGCTAMDVVALLKKYKEPLRAFTVSADAEVAEKKYPEVYREVRLTFRLEGELSPEKVLEAVRLSQTKYCGVSAMVSAAVPIRYVVELNGAQIGSGSADFSGA